MHTQTWVRWVVAAGAASLLATGCSKSGDGGAKGDGDGEKDRVTIGELLGAPDYENVDWAAQEDQVQEAIAKCMAEEGWEYIPIPSSSQNFGEFDEDDYLEQLKEQGNGIVYWVLYPNGDGEAVEDPGAEFIDPNQDYVEALSEDEMTAYYESLNGTAEEQEAAYTVEVDEDGNENWISTGQQPGCYGEAYAEVNGDDPTQTPEIQEALGEYYEEMYARVEADPRVVKLNEDWTTCMKEAGFDYEDQMAFSEAFYDEIQGRIDEVVGEEYSANEWDNWTDADWTEFYDTHTQEEIDAMFAPKEPNFTPEQKSELEAIMADEIDMAVAEYTCSSALWEKSAEISAEVEEQYALEHEDELKELAASVAGKE